MTRIGSLFSGIGGLEWGLESAFAEAGLSPHVLWQIEQAKFPRRVLAKHWPHADRSVVDVRAASLSVLAPVDVICGGFPCTDLSYAGKRALLAGEHSGLWREYVRIIREFRPRVVVVENVPALLTGGFGTVLGDLAASGYDASWRCIRASDVGAPHKRERLFIVAYPDGVRRDRGAWTGEFPARRAEPENRGGSLADSEEPRREERGCDAVGISEGYPVAAGPAYSGGEAVAHAGGVELRETRPREQQKSRRPAIRGSGIAESSDQPDVGRLAHGLPAGLVLPSRWPAGPGEAQSEWETPHTGEPIKGRSAMLKAYGNAVVPQVAREVGRWIVREGWLS